MFLLAIDWASVGIKAAQFILSFSILVILHELGHFIPAKKFGCRVEKFYLFFNPWFSLWKKQVGETEYGLGWIPLGGYVKISGMIDESMDKEQMKLPPQPWEFRSKPAWQRLIIMLGGVTVNVVLALVIFVMITWAWGEDYMPPQNAKYGLSIDSLGQNVGLKDGDVILKVGEKPVRNILRVTHMVVTSDAKDITALRDGKEVVLTLPEGLRKSLNKSRAERFVEIRHPAIVDTFTANSNAEKAGIQIGDQIIGIDSISTPYFQDFKKQIRRKKNATVQVHLLRGADSLILSVNIDDKGLMGFGYSSLYELGFRIEHQDYDFLEAIPAGIRRARETLSMYMTGLKQLFTGQADAKDSLGSVISIGNIFPGYWDWQAFWQLTAVFSIILAFMNILPIPGLDGGHALFTIYEMVTGRKPGEKFIEYSQMVGMILLLALMAYAFGLDIWRLFK